MRDFSKPVDVLIGLGFPGTIRSVARAHSVLIDWPPSQRGREHETALNACLAALRDEADAEAARSAFVEFARHVGILASDANPLVAAAALTKRGGSRAPK